ncbi:ABC transporter ATP-binding protein [Ligilactobacillus salitolerans]|uniref:ABC transporter ATP-binding protein n=1 Tax=Ligilactobacillus salitolerans TaxID=1808352 RepID=A0A401IPX9_9LACO|nr:ATP-binding cassette domain-containing protein [Ligilactobacillus salitolerans]GBG93586.1 ABC transporter ATP-binding protein [Ligilactobacillus salitolerans]
MSQIEIHNLNYIVDGQTILNHINLTIDQGEIVTISGPSGSGKSTLAKMIATLLSPTSGEIFYSGKNIEQEEPVHFRRKVSYAMQQPTLFGTTVRENLAFPYQIRKQEFDEDRAQESLKSVGLPANYLDREIKNLSGGEKQRVALLRNIIILPETLILDEVTAGLDADNRQIIYDLINRLQHQGLTIIIVTHDQQEITQAKRLITMAHGQIKGDEKHELSR